MIGERKGWEEGRGQGGEKVRGRKGVGEREGGKEKEMKKEEAETLRL